MVTGSRSNTKRTSLLTIAGLVTALLAWAAPGIAVSGAAAGGPALALTPPSGPPGTEVVAEGSGFSPSGVVQISFDFAPVGETTAAGDGSFSANFTVPDSATPIRHRVRAVEPASGLRASAVFTVTTAWPMLGFDAGRTGANPFENVLTPERVRGLSLDVLTNDRATSSAVYARGGLYVGMADGSVRFLKTSTGLPTWSYLTRMPVRSTPALVFDARIRSVVQDAVVVGSDDGRVYALAADTGEKLWRFQTGGPVRSSPLVLPDVRPTGAPSGLVVVGSNDGNLYALSLANGSRVWAAPAGGPVVSSAVFAVWVTAGAAGHRPTAVEHPTVAVGSTDGTLRAFDARTGDPLWSRDLGGKVVASPMVLPSSSLSSPGCDGIVGASTAGKVALLECSTGHRMWTVDVGSPVVGSPALFTCPPTPGAASCREVVVGTVSGELHGIDVPGGADSIWIDFGHPIRSQPAIAGGIAWVHTSPTRTGAGTLQGWLLVAKQRAARIELPTEPPVANPGSGTAFSPLVADAQVLLPTVKLFIKSDWPRFHQNLASTGFNAFEWKLGTNNVPGLHLLWLGPTAGNTGTRSSPAVADGVAYIGAENGKVYAFPASCSNPCSPLWTGQTDDAVVSTPVVASGVVYVGSRDTKLYAFPASCSNPCSPLWTGGTGTGFTNPAPIVSSPVVANGVVYVGALGGNVFAFPASCSNPCSALWHRFVNGGVSSSPAVAAGRMFVGGLDGRLYAFPTNCSNPCSPSWTSQAGEAIESSPAVANGVVYVGSRDGKLRAYPAACSSPCSPLWTATMSGEIDDGPAVAKGVVYVGSTGSVSSAFSAFPASCSNPCSPLWSADIAVADSAAVANGVVYVGSTDEKLSAFPATCSNPCAPLRSIATGDIVDSSPAVADGVVYLGYQNRFAAFGT